jgi:exopolyphosphatase/guanosine-5'-triphosphate,3'-diphosphate pyrophosphatase
LETFRTDDGKQYLRRQRCGKDETDICAGTSPVATSMASYPESAPSETHRRKRLTVAPPREAFVCGVAQGQRLNSSLEWLSPQRFAHAADALARTDVDRPPRKAQVLTVTRNHPLHVVEPDSATPVRTGQTHTRLGVLDIGSNTAQLQVVDLRRGAPPLPAYAVKQPTRLAEDIDADGAISPAGIDRLAEATGRAMQAAREHGVGLLYVFATAAIRDAVNRGEVIDLVEREAGVRPQFLSGEDEARLTYLAVHRWYGWSANRVLLIDIGGGSMEIVLGRDAEPDLAVSLPLGAGRLTRAFLPDDPPSRAQLKALRQHIGDTVREVTDRVRWEGPPSRAIATSKTFKQLARLAGCAPQRKGPFVRRTLHGDDLATWIPELARRSAAERAKLRGISPARARQVLAGALLAKLTMSALDIRQVEICPWALREGIMLHYIQTQDPHWGPTIQQLRPLTAGTAPSPTEPSAG